jgi:hypothetical protein
MNATPEKHTLEELLKTHTPEEIAAAYVFPVSLSPEEQQAAADELKLARERNSAPFTAEDQLRLGLQRLRFMMDAYSKGERPQAGYGFGYFLKAYIALQNKKMKDFAAEISIDPTLLSQLIHHKREAPEYIYFRLEIHSNQFIPADYWYRAAEKQKEHNIKTDKLRRKKQQAFVRHKISVSADKSDI